jgi:hypothetical protein
MYGLLLRLSGLDADAASAVRVIGFFDALVEQGATIEVVLQRTAALAGCAVGVRTADGSRSRRADVNGAVRFGEPPTTARTHRLPSGDEIWMERDGPPLPLDDLFMERFAIASTVALGWRHHGIEDLDAAALLRLAIDSAEPEAGRRRALARLGIDPAAVVYAVAVAGPLDHVEQIAHGISVGGPAAHATVGAVHVLVSHRPTAENLGIPMGSRIGIAGPHAALQLADAWREARVALRYTLPSRHDHPPYSTEEAVAVTYWQLGGFGAIAEWMPPDAISDVEDVQALDKLAADSGGAEMLHTLEVVAATESLRRAAVMLHLHHNSVAHRVARAEKVLGFSIAEPYSRSRLMLALVLRRLRASADLF